MKQRQANYELLRILAMMMVVSLHFLGKGGLLPDMAQDYGIQGYAAWLLEALCVAAVDIYVLISGYFLVDSNFRLRKLFSLWAQILFYSAFVSAVCLAAGILPSAEFTMDRLYTWIFPVLREHYWFATAYVLLYIFSPLLGKAVRGLEKKQFQVLLGLLLGVYCISSSVLPINIALDKGGYDVAWFISLYLVAAYLRIYGIPKWLQGKKGLGIYLGSVLGIFALNQGYRFLYFKTGKFEDFLGSPFKYNHVLCLLAAMSLFCFFGHLQIKSGRLAKWICTAASGTFGVYLLHENEVLRTLWPQWFGAGAVSGTGSLLLYLLLAVSILISAGILLDLLRSKLFRILRIN